MIELQLLLVYAGDTLIGKSQHPVMLTGGNSLVPAHVAGLNEAERVVDAQGREHADVPLGEHLDPARSLRWCCRRELDFTRFHALDRELDVCFRDSCARSARVPMLAGVVSDRSAHDRTKDCDHSYVLQSEAEAALLD